MKGSIFVAILFVILFTIPVTTSSPQMDVATNTDSLERNSRIVYSQGLGTLNGTGRTLTVTVGGEVTTANTAYRVVNATTVQWIARFYVSPPSGPSREINVYFPQTEWRPVSVTNPLGVEKTYSTEWYYEAGVLTIPNASVDAFGVWQVEFVSLNYLLNELVGPSGGPFSETTTLNINDILAVRATTPWITGASVNLFLTDPNGVVWYRSSLTTTGSSSHLIPSFRYRKNITIDYTKVSADLTNFPVLLNISDADLHNPNKVQSDGDDILFVQNGQIVPHEVELFEQQYNATHARLVAWVRANLSSSTNTILTMYYGNPIVGPQENPKAVWSNNYVAVWHLGEATIDEGSGAIHYDSTSGGYDGVQNGNVRVVGIGGYGQDFDGTNDMISVSASEGLNPTGSVSISGWFRLASAFSSTSSTSLLVMEKYLNNQNQMYLALVGTDYNRTGIPKGSLVFKVENSNTQMYVWTSKTSWNPGWYHFTVIVNATDPSTNRIFINGIDDTSGSSGTATWANLSYSADWGIGGGNVDTDQFPAGQAYFSGRIDEVRVSSGIRSSSWIATEYNNQNAPNGFYIVRPEVERVSPEHTFTKTIDSTAAAGVWTASVFYNDTGTGVDERTGLYEREFIVKHNSSLSLFAPGDAVSDSITAKIAGELLYVEVELTDDITSGTISGATVTMNWSVSGTATNVDLNDYGTGRYGITLNTSDLGTNKRWTLVISSTHSYYNDATLMLYVDLTHDTELTYQNVGTTPFGQDFTATLLFRDKYTNSPITGATITFANGTPVNVVSQGNGKYNISISTSGLSLGDHWYIFNASKSGAYLEDASVNVTFTLRPHYTTASVTGDLVTPYGWNTPITVVIIDTDTGGTVGVSNISSLDFTWNTGSYSENSPASYDVTLPTNTWPLGAKTVTLSVSMASAYYYAPSAYQFDIVIRRHNITTSVTGDLVTPYGFNTTLTVILYDTDNGTSLSPGDVSSLTFTSSYSTDLYSNPTSLTIELDTDSWVVGTPQVNLTVVMNDPYANPDVHTFTITIRNHYTAATVSGDFVTPYGFMTDVTVSITDLDTGTQLTISDVSSYSFVTTNYGTIPGSSSSLTTTLDTSTWSIGTESITLQVVMSGNYDNPASYTFSIEIRKHYTSTTVTGSLTAPYGNTTPVTVVITDLDTGGTLAAGSVAEINFTSSYGMYSPTPITSLDFNLPTDTWAVGIETVTLTIALSGNYYNPSAYNFDVEIVGLSTYLYHEPNDLIFPNGDAFKIVLRVNISEAGQYYGQIVTGLVQANFTVRNSTYNYPFTLTEISLGRYNLTIDGSYFPEGTYSITVDFNPSNITLKSSSLVIIFQYRPARSELASPDRAVTTPYNTDFTILLNFTDVDRGIGIAGATITSTVFQIYNIIDYGNGQYRVTVNVTGFAKAEYLYNITADKSGYTPQTLTFKVVIRIAYTSAIPTVGALDIPVGNDPVFYVEYRDIDRNEPITPEAPFTISTTWIRPVNWTYIAAEGRYQIVFPTEIDDTLQQNLVITFNFSKGENYQFGIFNITVTIRTHNTDLRLVTAVEPTSYNANISIQLFYGDLDDQQGIASHYVNIRVENETGIVTYYPSNLTSMGDGYYLIKVPASQFNALGLQNFTIYFNWTGPTYSYQNKTILVSANIVGEDSQYTLLVASEPTPYLGNMSYIFLYSELYSGIGITNSSYGGGHVHIRVLFQGITVDLSQVDIWEIDPVGSPGNYSIQFNTTIFGRTGVFYMEVHIEWDKGVSPFYTNRTDIITVRVLSRDTLLSIIPPSPTAYDENATFTFTFDDVTGNESVPVGYDAAKMTIWLNLSSYSWSYNSADKSFTVSFDTNQFSALGQRAFILNVTWVGEPFYSNRTGRLIYVTVVARQTLLDYQSPAPTQYMDNVTFVVTWTDVAGTPNTGIDGATVLLYNGASTIPSNYYAVTPLLNGQYQIEFNTTYYTSPGTYSLTVNLTATQFYYKSATASRTFEVRYRLTLLTAEPPAQVPYNGTLQIILTFKDLYTLVSIGNSSSEVTLTIVTPGTWIYTVTWDSIYDRYILEIETYNLGLSINTPYSIHLNFTYADQSPFYYWDDVVVQYEIRARISVVEIQQPPVPTPYNEYANFTIRYYDTDFSENIDGGIITIYKGGTSLTQGVDYLVSAGTNGLYAISVQTSALDGLGTTTITVWANWTYTVPHYGNASILIDVTITTRPTSVEIVTLPGQTRYLENVTFVISFVDLVSGSGVSITKNMVMIYNASTPLASSDFAFRQQGATTNYEISIDSTIISTTLVSNRNVTVFVNYPNVVPYYADESSSVGVTIIRRDTFVSFSRPANTAYGENASLTFSYLDVTGGTSTPIANAPQLSISTNLTETPQIVYDGTSISYTISFDTAQFGDIGEAAFYLNVTWAGNPYYGNQTLITITFVVIERQTQVDFQAPPPTPFGDTVTFNATYLDIAGSSSIGIPEYTFTLYYGGSPVPSSYYTVVHDGTGTAVISLNTSLFSEPGIYSLNASFVYTGTYHKADAWAVRSLQLRFRTTLLSAEPVASVGYGTAMEIILYFQDMLTLENIGSSTTFTILNNTGVPWNYTITWQPATQNYLVVIQTEGQNLNVDVTYALHLNMSYAYIDPYYYWDDTYVNFLIRNRTSILNLRVAPLPTSYREYSTFTLYYYDVDGEQGISGASISIYTGGSPISSSYYSYTTPSAGVYSISLNTSAFTALGTYQITVYAQWPGGPPFHNDATRNVSITVVERTTNVEIISPPSATKFLDNVTFTFSYTDTINGQPIDITASNIIIYGNGTPLAANEFIMTKVGSLFEISINSTVLSSKLVTDYNLTIAVDWNAADPPFYADDVTSLRLNTVGRTLIVEIGPIATTPYGDNMTISFSVLDDDTDALIPGAIIKFDCIEQPLTENVSYWLWRGTDAQAGHYHIEVWTEALGGIGNFHFQLTVEWDPLVSPYYSNKTAIQLIGSVDLIWTSLTADQPQPSSVQISQGVYVVVYFNDLDHGETGIDGANFSVKYLDTDTTPVDLSIVPLGSGTYNISFRTIDITTTGSKSLNITASKQWYTNASVQVSFTIKVIDTVLTPLQSSIQVNWTDTIRVYVEYEDLLHGNLISGATVSTTWGGTTVNFVEASGVPGRYYADIDTALENAGTRVLSITATKEKFATSIATVSLIVLTLPSNIVPIEPTGLVLSTYRGEQTNITIYLEDAYNGGPIDNTYVTEITGLFEGNGQTYLFTFNGTPGFYEAIIPGDDTSDVITGFYYFRMTAKLQNYNPASYQFTIELQQTRTLLVLDEASGTTAEMTGFYSEIVRLSIRFTELTNTSVVLTNATITWYVSDLEIGGNLIEDSSSLGYYYVDLDTTLLGYGIWAITIRAIPDDPQFSNAITSLTLTVKRITTTVFNPAPITVPWGWVGNISFTFWDEVFDQPVLNATALYSWGPYTGAEAIDLNNGTYLVPVDTTILLPEIKWSITISFSKANYVEATGAVQLTLELIETELEVNAPEQNRVEDSTRNLIVPMGDVLNITIYYGDIEMYVGGIEGASLTSESELRGDTFSGGRPIEIVELGNGYYSFLFDTNDPTLYEYTNGTPITGQSYRLILGLKLDNRTTQEVTIRIRIIDTPTAFVASVTSPALTLIHDDVITIDIYYNDTWHNRAVVADYLSAVSSNEAVLSVIIAPGTEKGHYTVTMTATGVGTAIIELNIGARYFANISLTYAVEVQPNQTDIMVQQATTIGLPISIFIIILLALYVKVWSVPKRVRQLNAQIRALRKGRIPKPVADAPTRQQMLAELFNDTYSEVGITRMPEQLPEESVAVEIPEIGELLMQLAILTRITPEELDEFKSDISKMKLSEQAAFIKEVINQEAIRIARREGKTVEQVLEEISRLAKQKIGELDVSEPKAMEEAASREALILRPEEPERPAVPEEPEPFVAPVEPTGEPIKEEPEVAPPITDRLSQFELEELRKQLAEKGVPPHEIDTIIEQAKHLSRELVDELIRSLTDEE